MDKIKFLMSDTGAEITAACREALEQKGVEVTVVEKDGLKVLQKMLAVRPQVVLLDAFMPGLDALAVKQKYNAAGERHTSFFVTGAFQSEEMVQELLDEGFAYYFVKPFDEMVLANRVLKVAAGQEKRILHTSVDSDELTVTEILHQIGVPAHIKGYQYLREAIIIAVNDMDVINAITKVSAGQKVIVDPDVEMDVVALAGTPSSVCAAVLRFREGRLTDKREFVFHDTTDIEAVREEFLPQYYLDGETIPKTIAVDTLPPDAEALNQALNEARGSKVELYVPQRGDVAKLVTMAYTNAVERLGRESGRYTREEKLLEEAAQVLGLKTPPRVIESYDISNWGDGSSVCGMVVFKDGKPYRAGYRRFKMRTVAGTDDYASMAETLSRRAAEYEAARRGEKPDNETNQFATMPDLLLIDGGRGQVSAVKQALRGTALEHVPTFGMVKDDHHRTRAIVDDAGGEIAINRHRNIFTFVTNIQDETHRYANDYRKRMMHKKSYAATLTELPGVGPKTSAALLAHFKTVTAVKQASISDLEEVKGISHAKAENIYNALRQ